MFDIINIVLYQEINLLPQTLSAVLFNKRCANFQWKCQLQIKNFEKKGGGCVAALAILETVAGKRHL